MIAIIFFLTAGITLYILSSNFLSREILKTFAMIMIIIPIVVYVFFRFKLSGVEDGEGSGILYAIFIPFFLFSIYYIQKRKKVQGLEIVANQQRYWEEITSNDVFNFFKNRKIEKSNRYSTKVLTESMKFFKKIEINKNGSTKYEYVISPSFFKKLKALDDEKTIIKDIDELGKYNLYSVVFKKLKSIIKKSELKVDYKEILELNGNCAEFFLMYLWEHYTQRINISGANLILLSQRDIEDDFIGALDNLILNSVKKNGAALYYAYIVFHKRDEAYIENIEQHQEDIESEFI